MTAEITKPLRGAIAAMTREHVIGLDGKIPWHYSEDLQRFKQRTLNSTIIMGRLTWESINNRALPQRRNIVISRNTINGAEHFNDLELALNTCNNEDVWIIGGGQIYQAAFDILNLLDITYVPDVIESDQAVIFPGIDPDTWKVISTMLLENSPLVNVIYQRK